MPALLLALLLAVPGAAPAQTAEEYAVKAAFLYNFTKFVEWPAAAFPEDGVFKVCVLGDDPFGGSLQAIAGEQVGDRKLKVARMDSVSRTSGCQILFISHSERDRLTHVLTTLKGASVLTVGDSNGFANEGVIVNFILEGTRVRFEINTESAERAGLQISSKLLQLARRVVTGP